MTALFTSPQHRPATLRRLLAGETAGLLAGSATQTTLAWWIAYAGGAADLARYGMAMAVCALVAMPLLSPLGDRWPKPRVVRWARGLLVVETLALALLAGAGVYDWPLLCGFGALSAVANAALLPAQASLLPELVRAARLPEAIRLRRGCQAAGGVLGPAVSGLLLATQGIAAAMGAALLLTLLAAGAAWPMASPRAMPRAVPATAWMEDLRAGLRAKWRVPVDRGWTLAGALMMVFFLPATGLLLPLRLQALGLPGGWLGACGAALSAGVMAGIAGLAPWFIGRLGRARAMGLAIGACGAAMAAVGLCSHPWALVAGFGAMGVCMSVTQLVGQTHRTLAVPERLRSRMAAAQLMLAHAAAALAPAVAGGLLTAWSVGAVYLWMAAGFLASGGLLLWVPDLRTFLRLDHAQVTNWYERQYPHAFPAPGWHAACLQPACSPLPLPARPGCAGRPTRSRACRAGR